MDIMEIKNKTTKELKDFSKRIDEEIKFREEVGREIDKKEESKKEKKVIDSTVEIEHKPRKSFRNQSTLFSKIRNIEDDTSKET